MSLEESWVARGEYTREDALQRHRCVLLGKSMIADRNGICIGKISWATQVPGQPRMDLWSLECSLIPLYQPYDKTNPLP
jgi:hypothetical protein